MSENYTFPSPADAPLDHPLRLGPGKSLSRLFARLSDLRSHSHRHHRSDRILIALLIELEEIETLLRHLTVPHGAISLDTDHPTVTEQQAPVSTLHLTRPSSHKGHSR